MSLEEGEEHPLIGLLYRPLNAFEEIKQRESGSWPLVIFLGVIAAGVLNDVVLISKIYVAESPPLGIQGPPVVQWIYQQQSLFFYTLALSAYYYGIHVVLEVLFNFAVVWLILFFFGKTRDSKGGTKRLFYFSFYSLFPMLVLGIVSILLASMVPYMSYLNLLQVESANFFYRLWEYVGWIGELWVAILTAASAHSSHSVQGQQLLFLVSLVALATFLRIYYVF